MFPPVQSCPSCGYKITQFAIKCPNCGEDLRFPSNPQGAPGSPPESPAAAGPAPAVPAAGPAGQGSAVPAEGPARTGQLRTPTPLPVSMDGVLAEVTSAMARWLDREPTTREQRASEVIDLLSRDTLLKRAEAAGQARSKALGWLRAFSLPLILLALLAAGAWFAWRALAAATAELAGARLEAADARSTLEAQQEEMRQAQATIAAQVTAMAVDARRIQGPMDGQLVHDWDGYLETFLLSVSLQDFDLRVRFHNPYDGNAHAWDFGIVFRNIGGSGSYRLDLFSTGVWKLTYGALPTVLASGELDNLESGTGMQNEILLQVRGGEGSFHLNGVQAGALDLSAHQDAGTIAVAIGIWQGNEKAGAATRFEDLTVWQAP